MEHKVVTDYTDSTRTNNDNIKVFVRARPPVDGSDPPKEMWATESRGKLSIKDPSKHVAEHSFLFDQVFWTDATQEVVFKEVARPLVEHCLKGYNGCCFAYGQTGSGKTYSIFGDQGKKRGILPRSVEHVFEFADRMKRSKSLEVKVYVSLLEMYCDEIRDLGKAYLNNSKEEQKTTSEWYMDRLKQRQSFAVKSPTNADDILEVHEDASGDVYVKDLSVIPVSNVTEVIEMVEKGFRLRATHETKMNKHSSRSHTIFTLKVAQTDLNTKKTVTGALHLVDLAGSERLGKSEATGQRLRETLAINRSLSALGKVAAALDPSTPAAYIPYRDSKLTRLLQNCIGGNSHTCVLGTLHPARENYSECLSSLQFLNRCRCVVNQPRINYTDAQGRSLMAATIRRLQAEIKRLRLVMAIIVAQKNRQLAQVLSSVGIPDAKVLGDGRVQLKGGRTVGTRLDINSIENTLAENQMRNQQPILQDGSIVLDESSLGYSGSGGGAIASNYQRQQLSSIHGGNSNILQQTIGINFEDLDLSQVGLSNADLVGITSENPVIAAAAMSSSQATIFPGQSITSFNPQQQKLDEMFMINPAASSGNNFAAATNMNFGSPDGDFAMPARFTAFDQDDDDDDFGPSSSSGSHKPQYIPTEPAKLVAGYTALARENQKLKRKLARHNASKKNVDSDWRKQLEKANKEARKSREEIARLKAQMNEISMAAESKEKLMKREYESKIQEIISNSVEIQLRAQEEIAKIPDSLKVDSAKIHSAKKASEITESILEKKHSSHVRTLVQSNEVQISNIKQQAEYWIMKKDLECRRLVDDFNRYHKCRTTEVQEYRKELILLYEHCNNLSRVINKIQQGEYRMKVSASRPDLLREVLIRAKDAPDKTLLVDPARLRLLREQINILAQYEEQQIQEQQTAPNQRPFPRPEIESMDSLSRSNNQHQHGEQRDPEFDGHDMLDHVIYDGVRLDQETGELNKDELCELVEALRSFFRSSRAKSVIEQHLLRKLSSNSTISYIKTLEEGLETYKQSFKVETEKYKNLRIAFESLQRKSSRTARRMLTKK